MTQRRAFLKHLSLISTLPFLNRFSAFATNAVYPDQVKTLKDLAKAKNLFYGCGANEYLFTQPAYAKLVTTQCNMIVCENAMKWNALQSAKNNFNFTTADSYVAFAKQNNLLIRGHNLCWHDSNPAWLKTVINPGNAQDILTRHIETVVKHYAGQIHSWDVVNEAIDTKSGNVNGLRTKSIWFEMLGEDYIDIAFKTASAHDKTALMTYNEYGLEFDAEKQRKTLDLIDRLKTKGIRIDALGTQTHIHGVDFVKNFSADKYRLFLKDAAKMGLKIMITEMDVNDTGLPANITDRDLLVANAYSDLLNVALKEPAVTGILTWGITDQHTWIGKYTKPRADGLACRPLPFDSDFKPKKAFSAIADALTSK